MTGPVSISTTWALDLEFLERLLQHRRLFARQMPPGSRHSRTRPRVSTSQTLKVIIAKLLRRERRLAHLPRGFSMLGSFTMMSYGLTAARSGPSRLSPSGLLFGTGGNGRRPPTAGPSPHPSRRLRAAGEPAHRADTTDRPLSASSSSCATSTAVRRTDSLRSSSSSSGFVVFLNRFGSFAPAG